MCVFNLQFYWRVFFLDWDSLEFSHFFRCQKLLIFIYRSNEVFSVSLWVVGRIGLGLPRRFALARCLAANTEVKNSKFAKRHLGHSDRRVWSRKVLKIWFRKNIRLDDSQNLCSENKWLNQASIKYRRDLYKQHYLTYSNTHI